MTDISDPRYQLGHHTNGSVWNVVFGQWYLWCHWAALSSGVPAVGTSLAEGTAQASGGGWRGVPEENVGTNFCSQWQSRTSTVIDLCTPMEGVGCSVVVRLCSNSCSGSLQVPKVKLVIVVAFTITVG